MFPSIQSHLQTLLDGLRGFIPEQSREPLEGAIGELKEQLDYDGHNINHISMALYVFQVPWEKIFIIFAGIYLQYVCLGRG